MIFANAWNEWGEVGEHSKMMDKAKKCYIIMVNYRGWKDTIECLESLLKLEGVSYRIIVCDNDSRDESIKNFQDWADGKLDLSWLKKSPEREMIFPVTRKPIKISLISEEQSKNFVASEVINVIQCAENGGFAKGNNIGIRMAMNQPDCEYIWCLNNDTVVPKDCLSVLINKMRSNPKIGICGAVAKSYFEPEKIQCKGGMKYNRWTSGMRKLTADEYRRSDFDFISGASMMISLDFLKDIGLMNEEYFLYFEELDWSARNKGRYKLDYCENAVFYHKEGASIGGNSKNKKKNSILSDYYMIRNRILFTKNYYPYCLPTIYLGLLYAMVNRFRRGQYGRIIMILKLMMGIRNKDLEKN